MVVFAFYLLNRFVFEVATQVSTNSIFHELNTDVCGCTFFVINDNHLNSSQEPFDHLMHAKNIQPTQREFLSNRLFPSLKSCKSFVSPVKLKTDYIKINMIPSDIGEKNFEKMHLPTSYLN